MGLDEKEICLMERTFVVAGVVLAILFSLVCVAILIWPGAASAADAASAKSDKPTAKHGYIGVEKCGMCHKNDAKGNQLKAWKDSKHAQAYHVLASKEANEVAEKAGVKGDPQKAQECLKCHVAALGVDAALLGDKFKMEDGVQCEVCHGAGADYAKIPVMKDRKKAVDAGLVIPNEETCKRCHNETAPGFKGFNFKEAVKKIAHPNPQKGAAGKK